MMVENVDVGRGQATGGQRSLFTVVALLAVALAVALACLIYGQIEIRKASAASAAGMATLGSRLKKIEVALQQQTAVTYAALGKVIPVTMPADFNSRLAAAEQAATRIARHQRPDPAEVKRGIHAVAELARRLPPWAQQNYLPRFNALRWALTTEYLLATPSPRANQTATGLSDEAQNIIAQLNSIPNPTSGGVTAPTLATLADDLTREAHDIQGQASELIYADARANAIKCLKSAHSDPAVALARLAPWIKSKRHGTEATLLTRKLGPLAADRQAEETMVALRRSRRKLTGALLTIATGDAYNRLASLKISLASHGLSPGPVLRADLVACRAQLKQAAAQQAATEAEMSRAYQAWAMKQIDECEKRYGADHSAGWYDWQYKDIMNATVKYLLPIRQGDLTIAVQKEYSHEFQKTWQKLKGREDQTQIAKDEATVRQLSPMDVWNKEHGK